MRILKQNEFRYLNKIKVRLVEWVRTVVKDESREVDMRQFRKVQTSGKSVDFGLCWM